MFARERDGYLRDRLDEDDDEDIEPVNTQKDRPRRNRASKLDDDDEEFEPVKIPVRSRHTRASYLDSDDDIAPVKTTGTTTRARYSAASCLDDDANAEPVMKLEVNLFERFVTTHPRLHSVAYLLKIVWLYIW